MKTVDYIVVGCGLASIAFCEQLRANTKSFVVFDDESQKSSIVAAGLYNPVILKRFTEVWRAKEQLAAVALMYSKIEKDLNIKIDHKLRILRRFASVEEQNLWFSAMDKPSLEPYLSAELIKNTNTCVEAPFSYGEVFQAGRVDTETLISAYKGFLKATKRLIEGRFEYNNMQMNTNNLLHYENFKAKHIIFAEGFGVKQNPYFKDSFVNGTKGEVLTIKAPDLKLDYAIKSSVFIIPLGKDLYTVGSTYNHNDKTHTPSIKGKEELISKLKTFVKCDFECVAQVAGVRPTVKDRRPLVGRHLNFKNLYILNGLGSRGVMIAPYVASQLFNFIEHGSPLDKEIDSKRFD